MLRRVGDVSLTLLSSQIWAVALVRPLALVKAICPFGPGAARSAAAELVSPPSAATASVQASATRTTGRHYTGAVTLRRS